MITTSTQDNGTSNWSRDLEFVQVMQIHSYHSGITRDPYVLNWLKSDSSAVSLPKDLASIILVKRASKALKMTEYDVQDTGLLSPILSSLICCAWPTECTSIAVWSKHAEPLHNSCAKHCLNECEITKVYPLQWIKRIWKAKWETKHSLNAQAKKIK